MKKEWYHHELKGYRSNYSDQGTYQFYPYKSLPTLPNTELTGDFKWLKPENGNFEPTIPEETLQSSFTKLQKSCIPFGIDVPKSLETLLLNPGLRNAIENSSITACFFDVSDEIIPFPGSANEFLVHFFSDQQYCCFWYLHFKNEDELGILISDFLFSSEGKELFTGNEEKIAPNYFMWISPDLESFILRLVIENSIWRRITYGTPTFNNWERDYLSHYQTEYGR
ncbi:MAG: hypothetical protein AAGI38_08115 [Bacteroidota bacterium]